MNTVLTFYIIRHGKTLLNTLDRVQGWCDSPLTPHGIDVARYLGLGMKELHFDAAYSSDLRRTRQTAEVILEAKGQSDLSIVEKFGFREACFGSYESDFNSRMWGDISLFLQYTSAEEMLEDMFGGRVSNEDALNVVAKLDRMGLAESFDMVEERSQNALREIAKAESADGRNKNIMVVSHGMTIISMLLKWGGHELLKSHLDNAAVCKVVYSDGRFSVESMGDMSFVQRGAELDKPV